MTCQCHREIRTQFPAELHEEMRKACRTKKLTLTEILIAGVELWLEQTEQDDRQPVIPHTAHAQKVEG